MTWHHHMYWLVVFRPTPLKNYESVTWDSPKIWKHQIHVPDEHESLGKSSPNRWVKSLAMLIYSPFEPVAGKMEEFPWRWRCVAKEWTGLKIQDPESQTTYEILYQTISCKYLSITDCPMCKFITPRLKTPRIRLWLFVFRQALLLAPHISLRLPRGSPGMFHLTCWNHVAVSTAAK